MRRFPLAVAIVPASLAVHLLLAACGGAETSTAQAGPGAGGAGGGAASSTGSGAGGAGSTGSVTAGVTTGSGSGGALPFCDCAPKPPTVYEVPCAKDASTVFVAELALPGRTVADLAMVRAVGTMEKPAQGVGGTLVGSVEFGSVAVQPFIADEHLMVYCGGDQMALRTKLTSVTFFVP